AITLPREVPVTQYAFSRLSFALAALHLNTKLDEANAAIIQAVEQIRQEQQSTGEFGLHWMGGSFFRIHGLFRSGGAMEGRLSPEAEDAIWQLFADWARSASRLSEADPEL